MSTDLNLLALLHQLTVHEGRRLTAYRDTIGKLTIGVGHNIDDKGLTITKDCSDTILAGDVAETISNVRRAWPWVEALDDVRQRVLYDMAFNLGVQGLGQFHALFLALLKQPPDYLAASTAMRQSVWYQQVGTRGVRLAAMMRTGEDLTAAIALP